MGTTELALPKVVELLGPGGEYEVGRIQLRKGNGVILENAKKLTAINSQDDAEKVTSFGRLLQAAKGSAEEFYKRYKQQVDAIKAPILLDEHADVDAYEAEKKRLGELLTEWDNKCAEESAEADRKAREEALRKAQEDLLLRAAEVEEVEGTEAAMQVLEGPLYVAPVVVQSLYVKPKGSVSSTTYKAKLVNLKELVDAIASGKAPIQAIKFDEAWCNAEARHKKEAYSIPGTVLEKIESTGFRR